APAPALMGTAAGAASLVSIIAHVVFCRREGMARGTSRTNGVRCGAAWRPDSAASLGLPRELLLALGMVCGMNWHDLGGPRLIWFDQGNRTHMPLKKPPAALLSRKQAWQREGILQVNLNIWWKDV
ncbi:MAG: hypothetical protein EB079_06340, partial [Verrucomicrobia bacterium]|nr:hypothetical protein [Verrucomicrobiota bacterium]